MNVEDFFKIIDKHYFYKEQKKLIDYVNSFDDSKNLINNLFKIFHEESFTFENNNIKEDKNKILFNNMLSKNINDEISLELDNNISVRYMVVIKNNFEMNKKNGFSFLNCLDLLVTVYEEKNFLFELNFEIQHEGGNKNEQSSSMFLQTRKKSETQKGQLESNLYLVINEDSNNKISAVELDKKYLSLDSTVEEINKGLVNLLITDLTTNLKKLRNQELISIITALDEKQIWNLFLTGGFNKETIDLLSITSDVTDLNEYLITDEKNIFDWLKSDSINLNKKVKIK